MNKKISQLTEVDKLGLTGSGALPISIGAETFKVELDTLSEYVQDNLDIPVNLTFYSTTAASDVVGYTKLVISPDDTDYDEPAVNVSTGAISTTAQLVGSLVSDAGIFAGNPGTINIRTVGEIRRVSGTGTAEFYFEVYLRNSLGVETLVGTSNKTTAVTNSIYQQFGSDCLFNNGNWTATDRVVIKYYADRLAGGSNPTYEFLFGGSNPVRTLFPISAQLLLNVPIAIGVTSVTGGVSGNLLSVDSNGKLSQVSPTITSSGSSGTSGVSGAGGGSTNTNQTNLGAGGYFIHNEQSMSSTTATRDGTVLRNISFSGFIPSETMTVDGMYMWVTPTLGQTTSTSFQMGIYDSMTYSLGSDNMNGAGNIISYSPKNRLVAATFAFGNGFGASADWTQGGFVKTIPDTQLEAGKIYWIGGYGTMSAPTNTSINIMQMSPKYNLWGLLTSNDRNSSFMEADVFTASSPTNLPFTMATFSLPTTWNTSLSLGGSGVISYFVPLRVKSKP